MESIEDLSKKILSNNIDGLRDALEDDDLFLFYKGVIECYGKEMFKLGQKSYHVEKEQLLDDYIVFLFSNGYLTTLDLESIIEGKANICFLTKQNNLIG